LAFIDETGKWTGPGPDPRQAGTTNIAPAHFNPAEIPTVTIPQGYNASDWTKLLQGNSGYMGWELNAGQRADQAAAPARPPSSLSLSATAVCPQASRTSTATSRPTSRAWRANPLSESARIERDYGQSQENYKRGLAARGALQSGDLGYGLGRAGLPALGRPLQHGQRLPERGPGRGQRLLGALSGLSQEQIDAIRQAAQRLRPGLSPRRRNAAGWLRRRGTAQYGDLISQYAPTGQTFDQMANNGQPFAFTGNEGWGNPYGVQPERPGRHQQASLSSTTTRWRDAATRSSFRCPQPRTRRPPPPPPASTVRQPRRSSRRPRSLRA
jgi:hypothetical protein